VAHEVIERAREWGAPYPEALAQLVISAALQEEAELPRSEIEQVLARTEAIIESLDAGDREINVCVRPNRAQGGGLTVRRTSMGGVERGAIFAFFVRRTRERCASVLAPDTGGQISGIGKQPL